ncbi:uncharacterized protein LOC115890661 [Sitophilus oryzae]|uniref:Uncharacterized protein LOC115890661 n=1 Tax=Sitophilus oryzae TaxID=7048 RepID=A0A6J2YU52_SITOR|nr:uncharacterized protein LOC115890661 [Sitophilus oryzae]XP_030766820.1 uncharacterized protein LOC115890661 [Sitophilus oryzae]
MNGDLELQTPKQVRPRINATSTVDRTKQHKNLQNQSLDSQFSTSLGLLSLTNFDASNILATESQRQSLNNIRDEQRKLANNTLDRATKVSSIPSKLLKPQQLDLGDTKYILHSESTVNESDLLATPKNTSTPRPSSTDLKTNEGPSMRIRDSLSHFTQMLDSNMSIQSVAEKFMQVAQGSRIDIEHPEGDSGMFVPAEEAESKLLADEMSWKRKNEMPMAENFTTFEDIREPSMSIGEFFQQRSDAITDFKKSVSPQKFEPLALLNSFNLTGNQDISDNNIVNPEKDKTNDSAKSLSISAIQQMLSETDQTPNKVINYLLNQKEKPTRDVGLGNKEFSSDVYSLPVSRNSSYTTSVSDNEAIRVAVKEDKENMKPNKSQRFITAGLLSNMHSTGGMKTLISPPSRSSSSLTSLPNGKLPIESTKSELVWGSVKVDRCVTKEFLIRNKTPKTLRLQCSLSSYEFKIRKDNRSDSDFLSACKFVLHGHESRPLIVSYIPTKVGAALDELSFSPLDSNLSQTKKQCVKLWGYGGYSNVEYQNAVRDNTGKYWLSLGRLDNKVIMEQGFVIKNTGNLPSFAYLKQIPKSFITPTNLTMEPELFVLLPNEEKTIKVSYTPSAKDGRVLKQSLNAVPVVDISKIEIVTGPESSRARLRRLVRKAEERGLEVDALCTVLKGRFPGEVFPPDASKFKESPSSMSELLDTFVRDELIVTIEQDPNQTLVAEYPEDSALFQTLCQESTVINNDTHVLQNHCRLEPPSIVLLPPNKVEDCLYLVSEVTRPLQFEVSTTPPGLQVVPADGVLRPGQTVVLKVKLPKKTDEKGFKVFVYVEDDVLESEVKLLAVRSVFLG